MAKTSCETCAHYEFDDYTECYICTINLDEDDMLRFLTGTAKDCAYWQNCDDYAIVKKQN